MTEIKVSTGTAPAAVMAEAAVACMGTTADLQSRLTAGWVEWMTHGMARPSAVAAGSFEAMRRSAETTLWNIEHCQHCVRGAAGDLK